MLGKQISSFIKFHEKVVRTLQFSHIIIPLYNDYWSICIWKINFNI